MTHTLQPLAGPHFVPLREFIVSPGFAGAAAVVAAVIALCAVLYRSRRARKRFQRELEQRERARDDEQRAAAATRCWQRFVWVVETAGIEPAASEGAVLGLGPQLALELLRGLLRDAEQLGDDTLARAVTVYKSQLTMVLAQQGGPLAELAATPPPPNGKTAEQPAAPPTDNTADAPPAAVGDEKPSPTKDVGHAGRRRRQ